MVSCGDGVIVPFISDTVNCLDYLKVEHIQPTTDQEVAMLAGTPSARILTPALALTQARAVTKQLTRTVASRQGAPVS